MSSQEKIKKSRGLDLMFGGAEPPKEKYVDPRQLEMPTNEEVQANFWIKKSDLLLMKSLAYLDRSSSKKIFKNAIDLYRKSRESEIDAAIALYEQREKK